MDTHESTNKQIILIGGGVSGSLTAYHLIRQQVAAEVVILDPRSDLGLGLAYSTPSLRHLLNVPAGKISALPEEPHHFLHWLREHYDASATETTFAPRAVFGRYIHSLVMGLPIRHERASVVDLTHTAESAWLTLDDGRRLHADRVVLATGNFDPAELPGIAEAARTTGLYQHDAWSHGAFEGLAPDAAVALIGTGLTGVDVVLRLRELGHRGVITAVSRHGVFPNRHTAYVPLSESAIPLGTHATCVAYLRSFHACLRRGADWRAAIDSLRATTNALWLALPIEEQRRFRRHLQRRWDVVRHRMAPPIADLIEQELKAGTLRIREGALAGIDVKDGHASVLVKAHSGIEEIRSERVINCTGPNMNYRKVQSSLLQSLFAQGLISSGPLGGGYNCTHDGAMIDAEQQRSTWLYNLGPGRLGTLLESIAVPEIREQAVQLAATLVKSLHGAHRVALPAIDPVSAPDDLSKAVLA